MDRIYTICMMIGFLVPLFLLLFGSVLHVLNGLEDVLGGLFDGLDASFDLHVDIGDTCVSLLPFSMQSISAALLTFGVVGKLIYSGDNLLLANCIAGGSAYVMAVIIQSLIRRLKKEEHSTYSTEQLLLFDAKVVNTIVEGGFGSICIVTPDGVSRTYPAKAENAALRISSNTAVRVLYFDSNVAIVEEVVPVGKYFLDEALSAKANHAQAESETVQEPVNRLGL